MKGQQAQVWTLVIASFFFYAYNYPALLVLLFFSIVINIIVSYQIAKTKNLVQRRLYSSIGVILNLAILIFFKYSPLIGRTFFGETNSIGEFLVSIPLPIGISFFTFQGISLVVDTFRANKIEEYRTLIPKQLNTHAVNAALFISFFPQLVAGPIVKAHEFLPQISTKFFKEIDWTTCFKNLTTGYFLKMVIADNLSSFTFWMVYPYFQAKSALTLVVMLYGYSIQIFADFAGYSLIAIGIAGLFGYRLPTNFLYPYISVSFSEYWRRWHISLSSFLKEYLYFSMGGNRKGKIRTYFNLLMTMVLGGLWHGTAWGYATWGAYHGLLLALERLFNDTFKVRVPKSLLPLKGLYLFFMVTLGYLPFKLLEIPHIIAYIQSLFNNPNSNDYNIIIHILLYSIPVILYHAFYLIKEHRDGSYLRKLEPIFYSTMLFLLLTNSGSTKDFIYFQF